MGIYEKCNYGKDIVKKLKSGLACLLVICLLMTTLLVAPSAALADTRLDDVDAGDQPVAVVINPVTNKIYVADSSGDTVTVIDGATNQTTTVQVGAGPTAVAVNAVTNKIYVANSMSKSVTVIDGATNQATTVQVGDRPEAVAVNPVTNKIYVANNGSGDVTVIDGATNQTTSIPMGSHPSEVAVNAMTNKIYVTKSDGTVTIIDGWTDTTMTTVSAGDGPTAIAVNAVTNKIYVANYSSNNVTVIDGADNSTTMVLVGGGPVAIAVNSVTNKIYVANYTSGTVTVIDGADNSSTPVPVGDNPLAIAVNAVTNKIYVANRNNDDVTVIDGASNTRTRVEVRFRPVAIAVNAVTNKIYVTNHDSKNVTVIDGADNSTTSVSVGSEPRTVAVNAVTNKIYVANSGSNNVTVIDGADNSTTTVPVGDLPTVVAVNAVTNKIYVTNFNSNNVTVIDGSTHSTTTVPVGVNPNAIAVNAVTNRIYVANWYGDDVTVIDGVDHSTTTVPIGDNPIAVAVNAVTNKIYVISSNSNDVMVIDGATQTTTRVPVGDLSTAVTVNEATNKIYVTNFNGNNVTVIDGVTHQTTLVPVGDRPSAVAVNKVTNKIYVIDHFNDSVTVIDGASHTTTKVTVGSSPYTVVVNAVTNKIYVTNVQNSFVTVIDGATNITTRVETVGDISAVAVNPVTNKIYVANGRSDKVTVIDDARRTPNPVEVEVTPLPNNIAYGTDATFTFQVSNGYSPYRSVVQSVYFQLDTIQGPWVQANASGSDWTATLSSLPYGKHELFVLALEAQGNGVPAGVANAYSFYSVPLNTISPTSASFDKYTGSAGHADVSTTFALNGHALTSIANGVTNLAAGTDYTVSSNTITISKAYLAAQPVGTTSLTFTFSHGATQMLEITVSDSPPTISPTSASFDKYTGSAGHADVSTTFAPNGNTLTSIANGVTNLAAGTDYTVSGNTITISKAYLAAQPVGTTSLMFTFGGGASQTLDITVSDSTPPVRGGSGSHSSAVSKLVIDVNGSTVDPDSIDTTKPFVAIEVTPKDGAAYVSIPATILTDFANENAAFYFDIKAPYGSYQVPVQLASFIPGLADLIAANRLKSEDISFKMTLIDRSGDQEIQAALADSLVKHKVMGEIVDFQIDIINTNTGQTIGNADKLTKALTTYIPMPKSMKDMPAQWGAFRYNESRKKFEFVAAKSVQIGGKWYVTINSYFNASHVVVENSATFTDTLTHWGKSFVELAAGKGLVEGVGNGQFEPNKTVTRAEFTAMLVRALGRGHSIGNAASYVDVKSGTWYDEEVATAKELGLLDFVSGTSFNPEQPLTREEMASMLAAVVELEELPLTKDFVSLDGYKDIAPADSAYLEDVRLMVKLHIMTGTGKNQFSPQGITTRAQAAVVLIRTLQVLDRIDGYKE